MDLQLYFDQIKKDKPVLLSTGTQLVRTLHVVYLQLFQLQISDFCVCKMIFFWQQLGLFLAVIGLATLPIGDRPYEVPNDRLQLIWFTTIWSAVCAAAALIGLLSRSKSWLLMVS
jgi:hypothetical protein